MILECVIFKVKSDSNTNTLFPIIISRTPEAKLFFPAYHWFLSALNNGLCVIISIIFLPHIVSALIVVLKRKKTRWLCDSKVLNLPRKKTSWTDSRVLFLQHQEKVWLSFSLFSFLNVKAMFDWDWMFDCPVERSPEQGWSDCKKRWLWKL